MLHKWWLLLFLETCQTFLFSFLLSGNVISRLDVEFKITKCGVICAGYNMLYGSSDRSCEFHSSSRHVSPWGDVLLRSMLPRGKWILGSDKETGEATLLTGWKQPGLSDLSPKIEETWVQKANEWSLVVIRKAFYQNLQIVNGTRFGLDKSDAVTHCC